MRQEIKTGGRVVKNVTGYDLCKLLTGSWGTLAVLTQVTFKVMPRAEDAPDPARDRRRRGGAAGRCCARPAAARARSRVPPTCRRWPPAARRSKALRRHARGTAAIRLEGFGPSIAYRKDLLGKAAGRHPGSSSPASDAKDTATLWREIRDVALLHPERMLWRLSVPPAAASELVDWTAALTSERLFDWAGGLIWLAPKDDLGAGRRPPSARRWPGAAGMRRLMRAPTWLRREVDAVRAAAGRRCGR